MDRRRSSFCSLCPYPRMWPELELVPVLCLPFSTGYTNGGAWQLQITLSYRDFQFQRFSRLQVQPFSTSQLLHSSSSSYNFTQNFFRLDTPAHIKRYTSSHTSQPCQHLPLTSPGSLSPSSLNIMPAVSLHRTLAFALTLVHPSHTTRCEQSD